MRLLGNVSCFLGDARLPKWLIAELTPASGTPPQQGLDGRWNLASNGTGHFYGRVLRQLAYGSAGHQEYPGGENRGIPDGALRILLMHTSVLMGASAVGEVSACGTSVR